MRLYGHKEDYNTRRKMEGLKILIIDIAGVAVAGVASWYAYNNLKLLKKLEIENIRLIEEKEDLNSEVVKLQDENRNFSENISVMYDMLKSQSTVDGAMLDKIKDNLKRKNVSHYYEEFIKRAEEELDRTRRYDFFKFSIMEVSIDFYEEYKDLYGEKVDEFIDKVKDVVLGTIRKVDYFAMGRKLDKMYVLLPMTDGSGGIVLATRLQQIIEGNSTDKEISTVTIAICEAQKAETVEILIKELERIRKEAVESGGNAIKVSKI